MPFLEPDPPFHSKYLRVQNIMSKNPKCFDCIVKVRTVYDMLMSSKHYAFPVLSCCDKGGMDGKPIFTGVIFRRHLCTLLLRKDFLDVRPLPFKRKPRSEDTFEFGEEPDKQHSLSYLDFNHLYPRWPTIDSISLNAEDMDKWMDLTPYMNPTPHTLQEMVSTCIGHFFNLLIFAFHKHKNRPLSHVHFDYSDPWDCVK